LASFLQDPSLLASLSAKPRASFKEGASHQLNIFLFLFYR
jgi:hypothetical protein